MTLDAKSEIEVAPKSQAEIAAFGSAICRLSEFIAETIRK